MYNVDQPKLDDYNIILHLILYKYQERYFPVLYLPASQYKMAHSNLDAPRLSYSAVTSGVRDKTQIETDLQRGRREIHDITVETVYNESKILLFIEKSDIEKSKI